MHGYVYDANGRLIASTQALAGRPSSYTRYTHDPADNRTSRWVAVVPVRQAADQLLAGESIIRGQALISQDGRSALRMQHDGNAVLYFQTAPTSPVEILWSTNTPTGRATTLLMQADGVAIVLGTEVVLWSSGVVSPGARMVLQNDGNLVILDTGGAVVWQSNTGGH